MLDAFGKLQSQKMTTLENNGCDQNLPAEDYASVLEFCLLGIAHADAITSLVGGLTPAKDFRVGMVENLHRIYSAASRDYPDNKYFKNIERTISNPRNAL